MESPLSLRISVIPKGQSQHGVDVVRFTADYAASDLYALCIGCYPPAHCDRKIDLRSASCDLPNRVDSTSEDPRETGNVAPTPPASMRVVVESDDFMFSGYPGTGGDPPDLEWDSCSD